MSDNKAFEKEWVKTGQCKYALDEIETIEYLAAMKFYEAGQRQMNERCAEIVKNNKDDFGINEYCFDYIFEDFDKEINHE